MISIGVVDRHNSPRYESESRSNTLATATKKRIIGGEAFAALQERKKKTGQEQVVLEIGGHDFTVKSFVPAAVMIDMIHYANEADLRGALDALAKAFVDEDQEKLLTVLGSDSDVPVDMEYVADLIGVLAEELTDRPLEKE